MAILVPVCTVLGALCIWADVRIDHDQIARQERACGWLPTPWTQYAAAWGGITFGVVAALGWVVAARRARADCGFALTRMPLGVVASVSGWLNVVAIVCELMALYDTYVPDGSGYPECAW